MPQCNPSHILVPVTSPAVTSRYCLHYVYFFSTSFMFYSTFGAVFLLSGVFLIPVHLTGFEMQAGKTNLSANTSQI